MSEQREGGTITSLEEVFLSREFGQASVRRAPAHRRSEEVAEVPQLEEVFLSEAPPLEDVFLSENFGRPERVAARRSHVLLPEPVDHAVAVVTPLHPVRESTRYRAIAAVSGVAAAALVVAGVASGGGHAGRPTESAQAERVSAQSQHGGEAPGALSQAPPITSAAAPVATTLAQSGATGGGPDAGSPPAVAVSTASLVVAPPSGTTVAPSPAPTGGAATSGGTGGASGSPAPPAPSAPTDPLAPVVASVGSTVSQLGNTVTSTVTHIGAAVPPVATVTALLGGSGTTLSSIGHALRSPKG